MKKYEVEKTTKSTIALYIASWICVIIGALVVLFGIYEIIFHFSISTVLISLGFFVVGGLMIMNVFLACGLCTCYSPSSEHTAIPLHLENSPFCFHLKNRFIC